MTNQFSAMQSLCGLSNHEVADFLGMSISYAEKIRRGERNPPPSDLAALAGLWMDIEAEASLIESAMRSGDTCTDIPARPQAYGLALARIINDALEKVCKSADFHRENQMEITVPEAMSQTNSMRKRQKLISLCDGTKTLEEVAAELGVGLTSVKNMYYYLRNKHGLNLNIRRKTHKPRIPLSSEKSDLILSLADGTRTYSEIAKMAGTSYVLAHIAINRAIADGRLQPNAITPGKRGRPKKPD